MSEPRPVGRPSTYDPSYCEAVIALGREGKSPAEIAAELDVPRTTMRSWAEQHEEFSSALTRAKDLELAWWEGQSREGIGKGSAFNAGLWKHAVAGRFPNEPYRERHELTGKDGGPLEGKTTHSVDVSGLTDDQIRALASIKLPTDA